MRLITLLEFAESVPTADFGIRFLSSCGKRKKLKQRKTSKDLQQRDSGCLFYNSPVKLQTGTWNYDLGVRVVPSWETILGSWLSKYREAGIKLFRCLWVLVSQWWNIWYGISYYNSSICNTVVGSFNAHLWDFVPCFITQQVKIIRLIT